MGLICNIPPLYLLVSTSHAEKGRGNTLEVTARKEEAMRSQVRGIIHMSSAVWITSDIVGVLPP
jgi:hypothetical protein